MKYLKILTSSFLFTIFTGCQLTSEYALMGQQQMLDSKESYTLQTDKNSEVDLSKEGMKLKNEMVGKYTVEKQWNRIVRWNIATVDIHTNNGNVIVDLMGKNKQKPFYGLEARKCRKFQTIEDWRGENAKLNQDGKTCGQLFVNNPYQSMIDMKSVKKGYNLEVASSSNIVAWKIYNNFIIPEDGYILIINYKHYTSSGFAQSPGTAYVTMYLKKQD
jgi:hypothetical protein